MIPTHCRSGRIPTAPLHTPASPKAGPGRIYRRLFIGLFLLTVSMVAMAAAVADSPLRVAMSVTPLSAPLIIAEEQGYFRQQGLRVQLDKYVGGNRSATALLEGRADLATASEAVVMFRSFRHDNFAVLTSFVESDNDVKILTTRDSGIRMVADLAGRRVGTILGASAQFFLDHTLLLNGVDTTGMTVKGINPEDTAEVLLDGELDAVVSWEPFIHLARVKLGPQARLVPHDHLYTETFNLLVRRELAHDRPLAMQGLLRALMRATGFIAAHPARAQAMVAHHLDQDLAVIQAGWADLRFGLSLHQWLLSTLEAEARWAIERGYIRDKEVPNYLDYLMDGPLKSIAPDAVTLIR